jgi:superfamily II DNA or RNA helicase
LKNYFGLLVLDEAHVLGAEQFSAVLGMFNTRYRLAVSATPNRKDGMQKILDLHIGPVSVKMEHRHSRSIVRFIKNEYSVFSSWANSSPKTGKYINEVAEDTIRNHLLARAIHQLYCKDRQILAISDRTEQLSDLKELLIIYGVPEHEIGIVAGAVHEWKYIADVRKNADAGYTPIRLSRVPVKIPKRELEHAKNNARIVLATYGMFSKGVDVPRLDAGIDCTPRSASTQVHGRLLRTLPGKKTPIWVTVRDVWSYRAELQFARRMKDYLKNNVEVYQWHLSKGVRRADPGTTVLSAEQRAKRLKTAEIIMRYDGNNTVQIQTIGKKF